MEKLNSEQRRYKRFKASLDVDAFVGDKIVQSRTRDICSNGIFINTLVKPKIGEDACVVFSLPRQDGPKPVRLYGRSVRIEQKGIAIQFKKMSPYFKDIFEEGMQKLLALHPQACEPDPLGI